ncbi:TPR-repeat-containing protein [Thermoanaerobacter kivui]|uniref:TPR-repeat-containing protein n=1 Tax=Thermoanaerobacter kivui TaxID=2325 RepID=A0A097AQ97_THEKI|nr:TPR-repeat-containing protein [Thermoanaerobacter kivui]
MKTGRLKAGLFCMCTLIFLTPGERVKKIRKMLKMKQRGLQSENITRGFLSMIESNRTTMSRETASIIAEKFNKRARELGIDLLI